MRQKFEAEDPDAINKAGEEVDRSPRRSQCVQCIPIVQLPSLTRAVVTGLHRSRPQVGQYSTVPEHHGKFVFPCVLQLWAYANLFAVLLILNSDDDAVYRCVLDASQSFLFLVANSFRTQWSTSIHHCP